GSFAACFLLDSGHRQARHSFPTRRSSDLWTRDCRQHSDSLKRSSMKLSLSTKKQGFLWWRFTLVAMMYLPPRGRVAKKRCCSWIDRKSTRLNSSHVKNSYAVVCLKKR